MKLIHGILGVGITLIVIGIFYFLDNREFPSTKDFRIDISEKLVIKQNRDDQIYGYDFKTKTLDVIKTKYSTGGIGELTSETDTYIATNMHLLDGGLFFQESKIFQCNTNYCTYYKDQSGKFLVIINKKVFTTWYTTKLLGHYTLEVFEIETGAHTSIQTVEFQGKELGGFDVIGFSN